MSDDKNRITSFEGLRFVIIICLIFHHFDIFGDLNFPMYKEIMRVFFEGYFSVNFFFVLSGFVIYHSYKKKFDEHKITEIKFLFRRIAHIYPLHLFMLLLCAWVYSGKLASVIFSDQFIANMVLLQSWIPDLSYAFSFNGLSWAVSTELFFYIAFVYLIKFNAKKIKIFCAIIWLTIFLNVFTIGLNCPISNWLYYINPIFRLGDFVLGMVLAELYNRKILCPSNKKIATVYEFIAISLFIMFVFVGVQYNIGWHIRWQIFYTLPICFIIYFFSFNKGLFSSFLGGRYSNVLGELSYPIFMTHQFCLNIMKVYFSNYLTSTENILIVGGLSILLSIAFSTILLYMFVKPANKYLLRCADRFI